jgi:predicted Fe-S protein YdhL (DUF1289 family)
MWFSGSVWFIGSGLGLECEGGPFCLVRICGSVVQWFSGSEDQRVRIIFRIRERRGDPSVWLGYVVQWFSGSEDQRVRIIFRIRERRGDPSVWLGYVVQWFSGSVVQRIKGSG